MFQARLSDLGSTDDTERAKVYCGGKYGTNSADFWPCVNHYTFDKPGDYVPAKPTTPTQSPPIFVPPPTPGTVVTTTPLFPPGSPYAGAGFFAPGWYMTIPGIALILGGAFVGYKLYQRRSKSAA